MEGRMRIEAEFDNLSLLSDRPSYGSNGTPADFIVLANQIRPYSAVTKIAMKHDYG